MKVVINQFKNKVSSYSIGNVKQCIEKASSYNEEHSTSIDAQKGLISKVAEVTFWDVSLLQVHRGWLFYGKNLVCFNYSNGKFACANVDLGEELPFNVPAKQDRNGGFLEYILV